MKRFILIALLTLFSVAAMPAANLRLVILGDPQPTFLGDSYAIFEKEIEQINALKPDAVVCLGDQIRGYGLSDTEKEWERFDQLVKRIQAPYYRIPGNHDVFSRNSENIYQKRFGRPYYSLDLKDCHLVMLDDLEDHTWGKIGTEQLAWLKQDLAGQAGKPIFVFTHIPVWYPNITHVDKARREFWLSEVHPLLKQYGVKAVFAGHFHGFGPTISVDGISYYISGGGGGKLAKTFNRHGGKHHFLLAEISDAGLHIQAITPAGPVSEEEIDVVRNAHLVEANTSLAYIDFEKIKTMSLHRLSISLTNPFDHDLTGKAAWEHSGSFHLNPHDFVVRIPARETVTFAFELRVLDEKFDIQDLPRLHFKLRAGRQKLEFSREIVFKRHVAVARAPAGIRIDGNLADWTSVAPLAIFTPGKSDPVAEAYLSYDKDFFYIAAIVHELADTGADPEKLAFLNDSLFVGIDRTLKHNGSGGGDLELEFFGSDGQERIYDRTRGEEIDPSRLRIAARMIKSPAQVIYEIALPASLLTPITLGKGHRFGLTLAINDIEEDAGPASALTAGIGETRGHEHFAEILLKK